MSSLKKFDYRIKDNRKRNIFLCGIVLVVVTIIGVKIYQSKAEFKVETNNIDMVSGSVVIPATHYLKELEKTNKDQLVYDGTTDNNLRYIGKDPNNYVDIGNGEYQTDIWVGYNNEDIYQGEFTVEYVSQTECQKAKTYNKHCTKLHDKGDPILWRIIGVMKDNNLDDFKSERLKIIRDEDIGMIAWDAKCKSEDETSSCTGEYTYTNNWHTASLQVTLNEYFWNKKITIERNKIYEYFNGDFIDKWKQLNFSETGINEEIKKISTTAIWKLGGIYNTEYNTSTASIYYEKEHSTSVYNNNPKSWTGYIGLMYPSDYGYATGGGKSKTRVECLAQDLYDWKAEGYEDCHKNNWLYRSANQWLMSPYASNNMAVAYVDYQGFVGNSYHIYSSHYRANPVLYLKSGVKIVSGTGTKDNPYKVAL